MGSIFGIIDTQERGVPADVCNRVWDKSAWWKNDGETKLHESNIFFGNLMLNSSPNTRTGVASIDLGSKQKVYINGDIKLYNRASLLSYLQLSATDEITDEDIILKLYLKDKIQFLQRIKGIFGLVIYDQRTQEIFCARDQMGNVPINYHFDGTSFVFGTQKKSIIAWKGQPFPANWDYICSRISTSYFTARGTFYKGIFRVTPAHYIHIKNNEAKEVKYWDLDVNQRITYKNNKEYEEHFDSLLVKAIENRTLGMSAMGAHMSGGLDSSAIAAIGNNIARSKGQPFHTFSFTVPEHAEKEYKYFNENPRVRAQIKLAGITNGHFIDTPIDRDLKTKILDDIDVYDGIPKSFNLSMEYEILTRAQSHNVKAILSGFPGDELVTTRRVPIHLDYLDKGQWWKFIRSRKEIGGSFRHLYYPLLGKIAQKLNNTKLLESCAQNYQRLIYNSLDPIKKSVFDPVYLKDNPELESILDNQATRPDRSDGILSLRNYQRANIQRKHTALRMESEYLAGLKFGVEYRYPLIDVDLMQFFLAVPVEQMATKFFDRHLFRRSVRKYLIPEIYNSGKVTSQLKPLELYREKGILEGANDILKQAKSSKTLPFLKADQHILSNETANLVNPFLHLHYMIEKGLIAV